MIRRLVSCAAKAVVQKSKFCALHKRANGCLYRDAQAQVKSKTDVNAINGYTAMVDDPNKHAEQLVKFVRENPETGTGKKRGQVEWAQYVHTFGARTYADQAEVMKKKPRREFVQWYMRRKGCPYVEAESYKADPRTERDFLGDMGDGDDGLRLWIPTGPVRKVGNKSFEQKELCQGTKEQRNLKDHEIEAMTYETLKGHQSFSSPFHSPVGLQVAFLPEFAVRGGGGNFSTPLPATSHTAPDVPKLSLRGPWLRRASSALVFA